MLCKIYQHLTYANVMSTIACFAFLATGTAYAGQHDRTNESSTAKSRTPTSPPRP